MTGSVTRGILHYKTHEGDIVRLLYNCPGCQREGSDIGVVNGDDIEAEFNSGHQSHHTVRDLGELKILENGAILNVYSFYGRFTEEDKLTFLQELKKCVEDRETAVVLDSRLSSVLETLFPSRLGLGEDGVDGGREYHTPEAAD